MSQVGFLGPPGTFTHQAARLLCPEAELVAGSGAEELLGRVVSGAAAGAVLPFDNTVNGPVLPTIDAILQTPATAVVADTTVAVSFDALARPGGTGPSVVVSHPHALAQCRRFVTERGLSTRPADSTAEACADLRAGEVALAPSICADLYDLHPLATGVEDVPGAVTHVVRVGVQQAVAPGVADERSRPSGPEPVLVLGVLPDNNRPGVLASLLRPIAQRGYSLTNILTRPLPTAPGTYVFVLFVQGLAAGPGLDAVLRDISDLGAASSVLGTVRTRAPADTGSGRDRMLRRFRVTDGDRGGPAE